MERGRQEYDLAEVVHGMDVLAVVGLYVGGVIGAGFASGQELVYFFVRYGKGGLVGILLSVALFILGTILILEYSHEQALTSYHGLFLSVGFKRAPVFEWGYSFILMVGSAVMFAGCAALTGHGAGGEMFRLATAVLLLLVLISGRRGILGVGRWLAPIIIAFLAALAVNRIWQYPGLSVINERAPQRGLEAALLYTSYNLGFSMAVLAGTAGLLKKRKQRLAVAIVANLLLGAAIYLLFCALRTLSAAQLSEPLPLLAIAASGGPIISSGYRFVLWASMFTTALANSFALTARVSEGGRLSWAQGALAVVLLSVGFSYLGFAPLIRIAYPLLGLAVLWFLIYLAWRRCQFS